MRYHYFINYVAFTNDGPVENDCVGVLQNKVKSVKQIDTMRRMAIVHLTNKLEIPKEEIQRMVIRNFIQIKLERTSENVPQ